MTQKPFLHHQTKISEVWKQEYIQLFSLLGPTNLRASQYYSNKKIICQSIVITEKKNKVSVYFPQLPFLPLPTISTYQIHPFHEVFTLSLLPSDHLSIFNKTITNVPKFPYTFTLQALVSLQELLTVQSSFQHFICTLGEIKAACRKWELTGVLLWNSLIVAERITKSPSTTTPFK